MFGRHLVTVCHGVASTLTHAAEINAKVAKSSMLHDTRRDLPGTREPLKKEEQEPCMFDTGSAQRAAFAVRAHMQAKPPPPWTAWTSSSGFLLAHSHGT